MEWECGGERLGSIPVQELREWALLRLGNPEAHCTARRVGCGRARTHLSTWLHMTHVSCSLLTRKARPKARRLAMLETDRAATLTLCAEANPCKLPIPMQPPPERCCEWPACLAHT